MPNLAEYDIDDPKTLFLHDLYANLQTYNAYLLKFTAYDTAPTSLIIRSIGGNEGEWIRFAIPYAPGTTFNIDQYSPVSSYDELRAYTYYYDSTATLLWVHLEGVRDSWMYNKGYWTTDRSTYADIRANCGIYCVQPVDPKQVNVPAIPTPPGINLCEATGNILGGALSLIPVTGGQSWMIFDETVDTEWRIITDNYKISTDMSKSGSKSLEITLNQTAWVIGRVNPQKIFPASEYTHFSFWIRAVSGRGRVNIGVSSGNQTWGLLDDRYFGGSIDNPLYALYPVDDTLWQQITIPLSALGLGNGGYLTDNVFSFFFYPKYWDYVPTSIYMDQISLENYEVSYTALPMETNNINYQYVYTPTSPSSPSTPSSPGSNNELAESSGKNDNSGWAVPVTVILCIIVAGLIGLVVYFKFFQSAVIASNYSKK